MQVELWNLLALHSYFEELGHNFPLKFKKMSANSHKTSIKYYKYSSASSSSSWYCENSFQMLENSKIFYISLMFYSKSSLILVKMIKQCIGIHALHQLLQFTGFSV